MKKRSKSFKIITGMSLGFLLVSFILLSIFLPQLISNQYADICMGIDSSKDIERYDLTGEGTSDNPYIIENRDIICSFGIKIHYNAYFVIRNCTFNCTRDAITIGSGNVRVSSNVFLNPLNVFADTTNGIIIESAGNCSIDNNTFLLKFSDAIIIEDCSLVSISDNYFEVYRGIVGSTEDLDNTLIVSNNFFNETYKCLHIWYLGNLEFKENYILNCRFALQLDSTKNVTIEGNEIFWNLDVDGFYIESNVDSLILRKNIISSSKVVFFLNCDNLTVVSNNFTDSSNVEFDVYSDDLTIGSNNFTNSSGIEFDLYCENLSLVRNNFTNCRFSFSSYTIEYILPEATIEENLVNGGPLIIYGYQDNLVITDQDAGYILLYSCSNVTIVNASFEISGYMSCEIFDCNDVKIIDSTFNCDNAGIRIDDSYNVNISDSNFEGWNDFQLSYYNGIQLLEVDSIIISNCSFKNLFRSVQAVGCNTLQIENNTFYNSINGILIDRSSDISFHGNDINCSEYGILCIESDHITVEDNHVLSANMRGIEINDCFNGYVFQNEVSSCNNGMYLYYTRNFVILNNTVYENSIGITLASDGYVSKINNYVQFNNVSYNMIHGILVDKTRNTSISYNILQGNVNYGIILNYTSTIHIHHNSFIDNNLAGTPFGTSQALESAESVNWWYDYSSSSGNFWSDYSGMGDYYLDGISGRTDPYPLLIPPI